jgi:hypothetical protein
MSGANLRPNAPGRYSCCTQLHCSDSPLVDSYSWFIDPVFHAEFKNTLEMMRIAVTSIRPRDNTIEAVRRLGSASGVPQRCSVTFKVPKVRAADTRCHAATISAMSWSTVSHSSAITPAQATSLSEGGCSSSVAL